MKKLVDSGKIYWYIAKGIDIMHIPFVILILWGSYTFLPKEIYIILPGLLIVSLQEIWRDCPITMLSVSLKRKFNPSFVKKGFTYHVYHKTRWWGMVNMSVYVSICFCIVNFL